LLLSQVPLVIPPSALAQFSKLSDVAADFAKKLQNEKPHMVAVADFTAPDGSPSNQGNYFASCVTSALTYHVKTLPVADHDAFQSALARHKLTSRDLDSPEGLSKLGVHVQVDFVITGSIDNGPGTYTIRVTVHRVPDASNMLEKTIVLKRTEFTDSLSQSFPPHMDYPVLKAETPTETLDRKYAPTCVYCPTPAYNDEARKQGIQGTIIFDVLISPEGKLVGAHPVKLLGYGLDEQAFNAIKGWRFKAAVGPDGKPVAVIVPIEVTFRLYRGLR
jgi:TonB family protein